MTKVDITAIRDSKVYEIATSLGGVVFGIKLDTGAKYTVISARVFNSELTEDNLEKMKEFCENRCNRKEQFISASGHSFWGYLVTAHDAKMGDTKLKTFYYYLVVENQRDIALLGFDFIDSCKGTFEPHSNIVITEFDECSYEIPDGAMESDEVIAFMDALSD